MNESLGQGLQGRLSMASQKRRQRCLVYLTLCHGVTMRMLNKVISPWTYYGL